MLDTCSTAAEEEWVIWNAGQGLVATGVLGQVDAGASGRQAWLDEPFEMLGPFDLDALERHGRIAFAACLVMSRQRWRDDQQALRRESMAMRQAAQQRQKEAFSHFSGRRAGNGSGHSGTSGKRQSPDEQPHREALDLPASGKLERRQVNAAFRRLAQKAHPDVGGSHEQFVRIAKAREVLLESMS